MVFWEAVGSDASTRVPARGQRILDFLTLPLSDDSTATRDRSTFTLERAWSVLRFGRHILKRGWWILESANDEDFRNLEIRLTSANNPFMTMSNEHNGHAAGVRIYLSAAETFDISVLVSPWPETVRFTKLQLRCLSAPEVVSMFAKSLKRLLTARNAFGKLVYAGRQFLRGGPIGLRLDPASATPRGESSRIGAAANGSERPARLMHHGDMDVFLGPDDTLDPRALQIVQHEFDRSPGLKAIYCDVLEGDLIVPRPTRDAELARWFEVAAPPLFFRSGLCDERSDPQRCLEAVINRWGADAVTRIPLPLVRRPSGHWPVLPAVPVPKLSRQPRVSVIIPTKYRIDLLQKLVDGLAKRTGYPNLEVVVVDNGSTDSRLPGVLEQARKLFDLIHVRDMGKFNFSRLVNLGVRTSSGEVILLMNDDVEPTQSGWLHRMVESVMQGDVGAVGARLLYPDRTIQHAGVAMGIGGVCGHLWKGLSEQDAVRCPYVVYPGERMAVTGACLAVRRDVFDKAGRFDEESFPVSLNDIDFCLRVRALGLRNIYRGDAVLIHYESQSRGEDSATAQKRRRAARETGIFLDRWRPLIRDDPFGSPEFDLRTESGAVHYRALAIAA